MTLVNAENQDQQHNLLVYIAAKSCAKLTRRIQNKVHSRPYLDRLQAANRVQIQGRDFPLAQPLTSRKGQRDAAFLEAISHPQNQVVLHLTRVSISRLMNVAMRYRNAPAGSPLPQIYTRETCEDFMQLLKHVIQEYREALHSLTLPVFKGRIKDQDVPHFTDCIYAVTACGLTLHAIVHTSFFDEHLQRLRLHHPPPPSPTTVASNPDVDIDLFDINVDFDLDNFDPDLGFISDTDLEAESEADFPVVGHHSDPSVWRTYGKRLRGLVSNFEAAKNLIKHPFKSGDQKLSLQVQVLAFKPPNKTIGDWKQTFTEIVSPPNNPPLYDIHTAIDAILGLLPPESKKGITFGGTQHCEASLAAMAVTDDLQV